MFDKINLSNCLFWLVLVSSLCSACQLDDPKIEILASDVLKLTVDKESVPADGESIILLSANLLEKTDPNKEVVFTTSYGSFINANNTNYNIEQITIKSSGRTAKAKLKVTTETEDRIFLSAELGGYKVNKEISTTLSYPEMINAFPDDLVLAKNGGSTITVEVETTRFNGNVSENIPISFSYKDTDSSGLSLNFRGSNTLVNQNTSVQIKSVNNAVGPFDFLIVVPKNDEGETIEFRLNLIVQ